MSSDGLWVQQMGVANRAVSDKNSWKKSAVEWHSYAQSLQRDLDAVTDQANGVAGVRAALVGEIQRRIPDSPLADKTERTKIYRSSINTGRVKRGLEPLSEQELAKL